MVGRDRPDTKSRGRLPRRAFGLAAALSLLASASFAVLWARSYAVCDSVQWSAAGCVGEIDSSRGQLVYHHQDLPQFLSARHPSADWDWAHRAMKPPPTIAPVWGLPPERGWYRCGFGRTTLSVADGLIVHRYGYVPYWPLVAVSLPVPLLWLARRAPGPRATPGVCRSCGYDLRASPGRCPECGAGCGAGPPADGAAEPARPPTHSSGRERGPR